MKVLSRKRRGMTVGLFALIIVISLAAAYWILQMTERRAHSSAEKLVSQVVEHIDAKMNEVRTVTVDESEKAYTIIGEPEALEEFVREFVAKNPFVYGSTVAFEPDAFPERGRCFAPYSWKTSDGEVHSRQLGTETDYYQEEWYAETKLSGEEYWCEPYFDEGGAKIMMCTFSVPLKNADGSLAAVMTADVGLDDLSEYIATITPSSDSHIELSSAKGSPLVNDGAEAFSVSGTVIIKGMTETGWTVELMMPFISLMRGDSGVLFLIGCVFLITILGVYFLNRLLQSLQQRSSEEYMNVIDSISGSYSSIFLLNLLTNETVAIRDPKEYSEVLGTLSGVGVDFTTKISGLIEYDCSPDDREMMHRETTWEAIRRGLSSQERYAVRFKKFCKEQNRWYEMDVFSVERDGGGAPIRAVVAFTDVNDIVQKEKETQETLRKALEAARSANDAKTQFLFNMSHDIRTPMNAIIGFTSMARKHIDDKAKVLDCLDKTQQSGNLLLALINSVLDVSRIESGHAKLEESPADVMHSFTAIEDTLVELAASNDIALSFEIGELKNRFVYADLDRCNRVFVNIISNAIKFTHAGGKVSVRCEQIDSDREGFGLYRYTFSDNGIGMSEEFQKHVFEQFSRENSTTVSGIQGSGLGLAVCKSFTELMGGTIECRSRLGEGTVFTVTLPFRLQEGKRYVDPFTREESEAGEETGIETTFSFRGRKVLLVEDNELNREIALDILEEEGLKVDEAEDGSIAVEIMKDRGPDYYDFILMDIQMPIMDGYDATRAIRAMYPDSNIPIIAVSANAFEEDRSASRAAGMNDHVAKPIKIEELFGTLAKFL